MQEASAAQTALRRSIQEQESLEQQLNYQEAMLGSERQLFGGLTDLTPEETGFIGRFYIDQSAAQAVNAYYGGSQVPGWLTEGIAKANDLMDQAQAAARAGNLEQAAKLKTQAEEAWSAGQAGSTSDEVINSMVRFVESPEQLAALRLSSPMGMTTGELVRQGREFLDPDSETSERFISSLRDPALAALDLSERTALRDIEAEQRGVSRSARDLALSRGSGRNPYAALQAETRARELFQTEHAQVRETYGAAKANVEATAAQTFETFSRAFAMDATAFGQAWLEGDLALDFQGAVDNLRLASSEVLLATAQMNQQFAAMAEQASLARRQQWVDIAGAVAGIAAAAITGGATLALSGAIAGAAAGSGMPSPSGSSVPDVGAIMRGSIPAGQFPSQFPPIIPTAERY